VLSGSNEAFGYDALQANTTGVFNVAVGASGLAFNTVGSNNTAIGFNSSSNTTTANNNIAIGYNAGINLATANSNNILIGSSGISGDSAVIRIGASGTQTTCFIMGIAGSKSGGSAVEVTTANQLGVATSSRRFKQDIEPMPDQGEKIKQLRPVTFSYKDDDQHERRYGLIAEEVEPIYPEIVRYHNGEIFTLHYQSLIPILLERILGLTKRCDELEQELTDVRTQYEQEIAELKQMVYALYEQMNEKN
jgi:hypothetical protein